MSSNFPHGPAVSGSCSLLLTLTEGWAKHQRASSLLPTRSTRTSSSQDKASPSGTSGIVHAGRATYGGCQLRPELRPRRREALDRVPVEGFVLAGQPWRRIRDSNS
jgi:hypothetical protein